MPGTLRTHGEDFVSTLQASRGDPTMFQLWSHEVKDFLGRTYGRSLDFSFGGRTENGHEMVLELVSGADTRCVLHHFSSLTCLKGSWGQVCGPKQKLKSRLVS
jgi:hypothetical protein